MTLKGDALASSVNNILVYLIGLGVVALVALSWGTSVSIAEIKGSLDTFRSADTTNASRIEKLENHQIVLDKQVSDLTRQADKVDDRNAK